MLLRLRGDKISFFKYFTMEVNSKLHKPMIEDSGIVEENHGIIPESENKP